MHFIMTGRDRVLGAALGLSLALHIALLSVHFRSPDGLRWRRCASARSLPGSRGSVTGSGVLARRFSSTVPPRLRRD